MYIYLVLINLDGYENKLIKLYSIRYYTALMYS